MLNLITRTMRLGKILLTRRSLLSRVKFVNKTRDEFRKAVTELKIPKVLEPELKFYGIPGTYGAYSPDLHWVDINPNIPLWRRAFHKLRYGSIVRHELKHSQQFLAIAGAGLNDKLKQTSQLMPSVAEEAHKILNLKRTELEARVKLVNESNNIGENASKASSEYVSAILTLKNNVIGGLKKLFRKSPPVETVWDNAKPSSILLADKNLDTKKLRELICPTKSVKQAWQELKATRKAYKEAFQIYWDHPFEREAREFANKHNFSLSKLVKEPVYIF